jgi:hypothetical protein
MMKESAYKAVQLSYIVFGGSWGTEQEFSALRKHHRSNQIDDTSAITANLSFIYKSTG